MLQYTKPPIRFRRLCKPVAGLVGPFAALPLAVLIAWAPIPGLLLIDPDQEPSISIQAEPGGETHQADVPYTAPGDPRPLADGLTGYAALGGVRLSTGLSDGSGAIVRYGFTRDDATRFLAPGSGEEAALTLELSGVVFDRDVRIDMDTLIVHLRLDAAGTEACGLADRDRAWVVTTDPDDPLKARRRDGWNARFGALAGAEIDLKADGREVSARVTLPAELLKHPRDPSLLDTPGGYAEPEHLHIEFQVLPLDGHEAGDDDTD